MIETCDCDDLVQRNGLCYRKSSDFPFTGKVTGEQQGKFKHGKHHGPWTYYWENGQLLSNGTYKNGKEDGPWVMYHYNGQLTSKGTYKDGKKTGSWVGYNKDGTMVEEETGTFKDGVKISD